MKIILRGTDNLVAQARVAEIALEYGRPAGSLLGLAYDGRHYGVTFNKDSITVWPQTEAA